MTEGVTFFLLCALVAIAPLPLASVNPSSWASLGLMTGLLVTITSVRILRSNLPSPHALVVLPFTLVIAWVIAQGSSLFPGWHHPLWSDAELALHQPIIGSISLDRTSVSPALIHLLSYAGVIWLAIFYGDRRDRGRTALYVVAAAGSLYALYGLVEFANGNRDILWYAKPAYLDSLTSTFVNRNSFATYVGLTLVCTTGLIARALLTRASPVHLGVLAFGWFAQSLALFLTGSRAGVACTLVGIGIIVLLVIDEQLGSRLQRLGFAALVIGALVLSFIQGGDYVLERFQTGGLDRGAVFRITTELIEKTPLTGTGSGTFEDAFRMQRRDSDLTGAYDKAHNTYLEDASELGIPATVLLICTALWLIVLVCHGVRRTNSERLLCGIGVAASAQVGLHSLVDFSLQIPAVAIAYCLILGIAVAHSKQVQPP